VTLGPRGQKDGLRVSARRGGAHADVRTAVGITILWSSWLVQQLCATFTAVVLTGPTIRGGSAPLLRYHNHPNVYISMGMVMIGFQGCPFLTDRRRDQLIPSDKVLSRVSHPSLKVLPNSLGPTLDRNHASKYPVYSVRGQAQSLPSFTTSVGHSHPFGRPKSSF
jgi:hypothetical protein